MIKLKDLLNEVKFKSPDYIISTTPASSLPQQKLGHADVMIGLKLAEKLKNYTLHVRHYKLVHADGKVALKLTPEGKTAVRVRTEDDPKYLQLIQKTVNDVVADYVSKLKESVNEALDPKAEKFLDAIQVNDRSIKDLKNITVDATPQGNWSVYYKGKRMFTLNGKMLDDKTIMKYGLEHMDESLSEGKKIQRPVNRWLELKNDESMHANKKLATGLRELKYQFKESVNEAAPLYKDWDEFVNPHYILVTLKNGKKLKIEKKNVKGGTNVYHAILKAFNDNNHNITNRVVSGMIDRLGASVNETTLNEDKVYIDFLNKKKGFKQDRIKFNSYEDAVKWAKKNFDKFNPDMIKYESVNEAQAKYDVYHNSYTSAIQSAKEYAEKQGYTINDDDSFTKIGLGPRKPSEGKTNRFSIELSKDGKVQRKMLQIQVYGMRNKYELNCYIG
jgi:hypothetical protein